MKTETTHTPNGYDPRWIEAINDALASRETGIKITDIQENLWDEFLGPMLDAIENDAASPFTLPMVEFAQDSEGY